MGEKKRKLTVGLDLNRFHPQICCYEEETDNTVTAPVKIGNQTVSFGDILDGIDEAEGTDEEERSAETFGRNAADLIRQSFATFGIQDPAGQVTGMTVTVPHITKVIVKMLRAVFENLGIDRNKGFIQDYRESFYYHTLFQKKEYWTRNVGFFDFEGKQVSFYSLSVNNQTRPLTVTVSEGVTITLKGDRDEWDSQFYNMADLSLRQNIFSSIFIQGENFDRTWFEKSVSLLCKGGRKVFAADNIFARGACFASREKTGRRVLGGYLYLGDDLVKTNIGMNMIVQGKETYYPLISAGINWYEADKVCECILTEGDELNFLTQGIDGGRKTVRMKLSGLEDEKRPSGTVRLRLHLYFNAPGRCILDVEDLGFGDIYPSSGTVWREILEG